MHLTCTNMAMDKLDMALKRAKEEGLQNILALRGDPPLGQERWTAIEGGFNNAVDLVRYIRQKYGNHFGISVAGYPEGHIESNHNNDLKYLKEKVDAGADFIVTQLFYNVPRFLQWVKECRDIGITCPILPGIMPIHTYQSFVRMTDFCKTDVPQHIRDALEPIKGDDEAVKNYGIQLGIEMCKQLLDAGTPGVHFYTLNLEKSVMSILEGLQMLKPGSRELPWMPSKQSFRKSESVRPIFWNNRPKSYIARTEAWDEFPNGRWGYAKSPAFGDLSDYHLVSLHTTDDSEDSRKLWGEPGSPQQVFDVFVRYCEGAIPRLPWTDKPLHIESANIRNHLVRLNRHGFLTINSQPRCNGVSSSDPTFGWGSPDGFVYQKAYVEFFTSPQQLQELASRLHGERFKSLTFAAINLSGDQYITNNKGNDPIAVTWGVFPCKEIVQPTVVDPDAFKVWKGEAFALWKARWLVLYNESSTAHKIINEMIETYFLVHVVDHNYVSGNIWQVFDDIIVASK